MFSCWKALTVWTTSCYCWGQSTLLVLRIQHFKLRKRSSSSWILCSWYPISRFRNSNICDLCVSQITIYDFCFLYLYWSKEWHVSKVSINDLSLSIRSLCLWWRTWYHKWKIVIGLVIFFICDPNPIIRCNQNIFPAKK